MVGKKSLVLSIVLACLDWSKAQAPSLELPANTSGEEGGHSSDNFQYPSSNQNESLPIATFSDSNPCAHVNISQCFQLIAKAMNETEQMVHLANATLRNDSTIQFYEPIQPPLELALDPAANAMMSSGSNGTEPAAHDSFDSSLESLYSIATNPEDAAKIIEAQSVMAASDGRDSWTDMGSKEREHLLQELRQQHLIRRAISQPQIGAEQQPSSPSEEGSKRRKRESVPHVKGDQGRAVARSRVEQGDRVKWNWLYKVDLTPSLHDDDDDDDNASKGRDKRDVSEADEPNHPDLVGEDLNLIKVLTNSDDLNPSLGMSLQMVPELTQGLGLSRNLEAMDEILQSNSDLSENLRKRLANAILMRKFVHPVLKEEIGQEKEELASVLKHMSELKPRQWPARRRRRQANLEDFLSSPNDDSGMDTDSFLAKWASDLNYLSNLGQENGSNPNMAALTNASTTSNPSLVHEKKDGRPGKGVIPRGLVLKVILPGDSNLKMGQLVDGNLNLLQIVSVSENQTKEDHSLMPSSGANSSGTQDDTRPQLDARKQDPTHSLENLRSNASESNLELSSNHTEANATLSSNSTEAVGDNRSEAVASLAINGEENGSLARPSEDMQRSLLGANSVPDFRFRESETDDWDPSRRAWEEDDEEEDAAFLNGHLNEGGLMMSKVLEKLNNEDRTEERLFKRNPLNQAAAGDDGRHMHFHFKRT